MADWHVARRSLRAFAEAVGFPLASFQARSLESLDTLITAIVGPRQSGKSRALALLGLWWAFRRRGQTVLVVSASELSARLLLGQVREILGAAPALRGSVVDEQSQLVELTNGSRIRSVAASERSIRGHTVDLLILDEAAMPAVDGLMHAALPTVAARPNARVVMASSASAAGGAFYDHVVRGEQGAEHVRSHRWSLADCEWISPSMIAAARESMTPQAFAAEYEGQFSSASDSLFPRSVIDRVTADFRLWPLAALEGPARVAGGIDWGARHDRSTLVAVARLPQAGERVFGVVCAQRWPAGMPLHTVVSEIVGAPVHFHRITAEANGLGEPCCQDLFRRLEERDETAGGGRPDRYVVIDPMDLDDWVRENTRRAMRERLLGSPRFATRKVAVHTTAQMKAATYSALRLLVDRESLLVPASAEELIRELLMLRVDLAPGGTERIEASAGHDDLADGLALSLGPWRDRQGRWRTVIGDLADPAAEVPPMPTVTAPAGELVATPGGKELPRSPVLQSIHGPERTGGRGEGRREQLHSRVAEALATAP